MPDINRAYTWAIETCNAPNIGYSQTYRNQRVVNGITYYDCSSFIWYSLIAGGFDCVTANGGDTWPFVTSTMGNVLTTLGFITVDRTGELLPGDIGVRDGHTEMYYTGGAGTGRTMGAHSPSRPLADQVSINDTETEGTAWDTIYRYGSGASQTGYSLYVISAIAGNFWQESTLNPGLWQGLQVSDWTDLGAGYGLGQWTNTGGDPNGRLYQLHEWLTQNGYADDSGPGQMQYLITENIWYPSDDYPDFSNLSDFLNSTSTDLAMLTHAFNLCWEGIHDESWDLRVTYAETCYGYIQAHAQDTTITEWITGNRYLSNDERLNNGVMLYRLLSAGGGGGGTGSKARKMPLWMYCRYTY